MNSRNRTTLRDVLDCLSWRWRFVLAGGFLFLVWLYGSMLWEATR